MKFSVIYRPTALFSLRDSNATSSGAKSLFLPSPYAIKMAFLSQATSLGGVDFEINHELFEIIRDAKISYHIYGNYCVNNCFIKIQKKRDRDPFISTVSFREYIYMSGDVELIFDVEKSEDIIFMKKYLHTINYFGKRGCFFQFIAYNDNPTEPNVTIFNPKNVQIGLIQEYDDFDHSLTYDNVNSYSEKRTQRTKIILVLPLVSHKSSKSYTSYTLLK